MTMCADVSLDDAKHSPKSGRDAKGRLMKGHRHPGPGNPHGAVVERFRSKLVNGTSFQEINNAWRALLREADKGNVSACAEVLDRFFGKNKCLATGETQAAVTIQLVQLLADPRAMADANQLAKTMVESRIVNTIQDTSTERMRPDMGAATIEQTESAVSDSPAKDLPKS